MGCARTARQLLALLLGLAALPAGAAGFGVTLGASSDSVFRGVSESAGDPAVQAGVHYAWDNGAFAGLRGATTKARAAYGYQDAFEVDAFLGHGIDLGDAWSGRAMLVHYEHSRSDPQRRGYDELALAATWLGRLTLSAAVSPNRPGLGGRRDAAYDYELALRWPVTGALSLDAGIGHYDLRRSYGIAYGYWSLGATHTWRRATLGLAWIGADDEARAGYGELAEDRLVASVLWSF